MNSDRLKEFRQAAYELLVVAKDATFELMDAVMTTRNASCLAEFALIPLFTRQWSSAYEALQDSRPDRKKLMLLYIKQLEQEIPEPEHVLVAIDHTAWDRPDARTLKDRTYQYQMKIREWKNLHFYRAAGHLVNLIRVERTKPMSNGPPFPPLWLAWVGERTLPLATVWLKYLCRICE